MITIKQMKELHWNKKLRVDDFARQLILVDEDADPIFKLWMQKLLNRFFEGISETAEKTIGEWSADIDSFMEHLLSHQPKPNTPNAFNLSSIDVVNLIPMEKNSEDD